MSTFSFNLRGLSAEMLATLKREAKKLHTSVNALILTMIERNLGISGERAKTVYHDLDSLAGTWSLVDSKNFEKNTQYFEQVDKELWS